MAYNNARSRGGAPSGGNLFSSPDARIAESNRRLLEQQNDSKTNALADSISQLKGIAVDINGEVEDQNRLLSSMDGDMGNASSMLNDTLNKLGTMLNSPDSQHMVYLIVIIVCMFVIGYTYFVKLQTGDTTEEAP
jgi:hypothetical protein